MFNVHLKAQSEYSLLESSIKLKDLPSLLKKNGYTYAALTDTNAMYGAVNFSLAMKKEGLHALLGATLFLQNAALSENISKKNKQLSKITLLAETNQGLENIHQLLSLAHQRKKQENEIFITEKELLQYQDGIIFLIGTRESEIAAFLAENREEKAKECLLWYLKHLKETQVFVEVQNQGLYEEALLFSFYLKMQKTYAFSMVATQTTLYEKESDREVVDLLHCIKYGKKLKEKTQEKGKFHLFSAKEMENLFSDYPELLENANKIALRCKASYDFEQVHLPKYPMPEKLSSFSSKDFLKKLALHGLEKKYPHFTEKEKAPYLTRLNEELEVISKMGFVDYFLIVADFIAFAKKKGVAVGPGRGSGASSLIAYCTGITNIDPLKYDLIFERFLNQDRVSLPDFDIDFCFEKRQEVIDYVYKKYGKEHTAQIITFGTLAAKAALRDVGRILDLPVDFVNHVCKEVPMHLHISIEEALKESKNLQKLYQESSDAKKMLDLAQKIEGLPRHSSTHAAGLVICGKNISKLCPLSYQDEVPVTQFDKDALEKIGLLKFDFLGLRTLTVIEESKKLIKKDFGIDLDMDKISYQDEKVFEMISKGDTEGVFQLESYGMVAFLKELKPTHLEDLIAGLSLFRPGPMEQIPRYIEAKRDVSKIKYHHKSLEPILKNTFGTIVYQEQVMRIVRDLAGFSMGQADVVRRAMSKKNAQELAYYEKTFLFGGLDEKGNKVEGCIARGVSEEMGRKIFQEVLAFAGYAFNKPHAAAYAYLSYQTAWLKYHYPTQFYVALLNGFLGNLSQSFRYLKAAQNQKIQLLPLDIGQSEVKFSSEKISPARSAVEKNDAYGIRLGLGAVKYVGFACLEKLLEDRQKNGAFSSLEDVLERARALGLHKKSLESLAMAGAFSNFEESKNRCLEKIKIFYEQSHFSKNTGLQGQLSLLESLSSAPKVTEKDETRLKFVEKESPLQSLQMEKEMLGFYYSGHPLAHFAAFEKMLSLEKDREEKAVLALLLGIKKIKTKKGETMAFLRMEQEGEELEAVLFPKTYEKFASILNKESVYLVYGKITQKKEKQPSSEELLSLEETTQEETHSMLVEDMVFLSNLTKEFSTQTRPQEENKLVFRLKETQHLPELKPLLAYLEKNRGAFPCYLFVEKTQKEELLPSKYWLSSALANALSKEKSPFSHLWGSENVLLYKKTDHQG